MSVPVVSSLSAVIQMQAVLIIPAESQTSPKLAWMSSQSKLLSSELQEKIRNATENRNADLLSKVVIDFFVSFFIGVNL